MTDAVISEPTVSDVLAWVQTYLKDTHNISVEFPVQRLDIDPNTIHENVKNGYAVVDESSVSGWYTTFVSKSVPNMLLPDFLGTRFGISVTINFVHEGDGPTFADMMAEAANLDPKNDGNVLSLRLMFHSDTHSRMAADVRRTLFATVKHDGLEFWD